MLRRLKDLYLLLTKEQRKKLLKLQGLIIVMSFAEIAGVMSIGPFMALVGDMTLLEKSEGIASTLYRMSGVESPRDFLFWLGIMVLVVLAAASFVSMFTVWRLSLYGAKVGAELGNRLYRFYMYQPWLYHANTSSSHLTKQISQETLRMTNFVINPLLHMNAKLVMAFLMAVVIFLYDPMVAIIGISIFVASYYLLFVTVRRRLVQNGKAISETQSQRFKLMAEGFGGIKDALLLGHQKTFIDRFEKPSLQFAQAAGSNQAISQVPRYAMELVAFSSVIFLVLYLLATHNGNLGTILPVLSIYAMAGFKILPALQKVYSSMSQIRGNLASFEAVRDDLYESSEPREQERGLVVRESMEENLIPHDVIRLDNIVFSYPGTREFALNGVDMEIPANRMIGIVGASGSGKSTIIDILLGLIDPDQGEISIDGVSVEKHNKRQWQNTLGFVPQSIFLADASIRENIAFGVAPEDIDEDGVRRAAGMANLHELLEELPNGLETCVGERGVQLSGGQRQRIGIARALYHDAEVLILDEATSALDGITEKLIMEGIHEIMGKKTIIMIAHRLATVRQCNRIYLMKEGRVIDSGSYSELSNRNEIFQRMAAHS
ncbi:ABC transporter ATP-binding protein [Billgrantia pellis]|uniref:ABC transporter ATP-binding protein n=1 Tax=Billgrantia pellis TaxID=2606936 RepID=A0A7V7G3R7_9GAMM|nr:ABC transporter ATP-binding protein [Halomonas pellis]KAA0014336.1 ABC transporter ATP-binding protein [Halomonas pellis]